jgi:hypothetical protein
MGEAALGFRPLERFSDRYTLTGLNRGGFFLRKNPLEGNGSGVQQSENRYNLRLLRSDGSSLSIRLESLLCPGDGLGMAAHQILVSQSMGADDLVARRPVAMLLADDPVQQDTFREIPAQQCVAG